MYSGPMQTLDKTGTLSVHGRLKQNPEYAIRQYPQKYDSYQALIYHHAGIVTPSTRRRLSSSGEGSGDSSTTASGSSYGEREEGSDRADSEETDPSEHSAETTQSGLVTENERLQVETFFRGLKTQVC